MQPCPLRVIYLLLTLTVPLPAITAGVAQPFSVTLEAPDKPVRAGSELVLRATLKNLSDHDLVVPTSPGEIPPDAEWYEIKILDAHGHPAPPSASVLAQRGSKRPSFSWAGSGTSRKLKPGESLLEEINITRFYNLSQPGVYTIRVIRPLPVGVPPWAAKKYWKGSVKSNRITLTVVK